MIENNSFYNTGLALIQNIENTRGGVDYIVEFQKAFLKAFPETQVYPAKQLYIKRQLLRVFRRIYPVLHLNKRMGLPRSLCRGKSFRAMCGADFAYCIPSCFIAEKNFIYMWDSWPRGNQVLVDWAKIFSIDTIFFAAKQSTDLFCETNKGITQGIWVPEGIYPDDYYYHPVEKKHIDVLEFGRRYDSYHQMIRPALAKAGYQHSYRKVQETHLKTKSALCDALASAKVSICFPSNITHPLRAEYISTMTLRYLESMISKCLVVGSLPYDMQFLFDYNPVIEVDTNNPSGQLLEILKCYSDYVPLIEKNYETVMSRHLWSHRMDIIKEYIL